MKKLALVTMSAMFVGSLAFAADTKNESSTTTDTSKNPITGTETTTKKVSKNVKNAAGGHDETTTKHKTKKHKDGKKEKSGDIRPRNILIDDKGNIAILNSLSFPD